MYGASVGSHSIANASFTNVCFQIGHSLPQQLAPRGRQFGGAVLRRHFLLHGWTSAECIRLAFLHVLVDSCRYDLNGCATDSVCKHF